MSPYDIRIMDSHRNLRVWRLSQQLVVRVYELSDKLPSRENYVASQQIRRAAWSVHNNIAEGNAKLGPGERRRFFDSAIGSLAEVDAMVDTLPRLYRVDDAVVSDILRLRGQVNGGIFALLRGAGR